MSLAEATDDFEDDAQGMSADGYSVVSQSWDQPDLTRALSILAFLFFVAGFVFSLFLLVVGVILTFLALALRRDGTLSVTYQRPTDIPSARTADPPKLARPNRGHASPQAATVQGVPRPRRTSCARR